MKRSRLGMIGSAVGLVAFLVFGLAPLMEFGETMGRMLATVAFGRPLPETLLTTAFVYGCAAVCLMAFVSFFMVVGGALAGMVDHFLRVYRIVRRRRRRNGRRDPAPA